MSSKIIYILVFSMAFVTVTLGIIELNNNFRNIFAFDFAKVNTDGVNVTLIKTSDSSKIAVLKDYFKDELKTELVDSMKVTEDAGKDTVYKEVVKDESLLDSIKYLKKKLKEIENGKAENRAEKVSKADEADKGTDEEWVKSTAKLLESMVPLQAAKVLSQYSDNEARNVIYKMKNKKAAEILSLLSPDYVNRITKPKL